MPFRPMNSDHSIEAIGFSLTFDRPLGKDEIQSIRYGHDTWLTKLPALQFDETPSPGRVHFAFLQPDGTASWELTATGNAVSIVCRQYTRWTNVWSQALELFSAVSVQLTNVNNKSENLNVSEVTLEAVDRFIDDKANSFDLKELFVQGSPRVLQSMFDAGPNWHQHTGSFTKWSGDLERLEQINFGSNQLPGLNANEQSEKIFIVRLTHVQRLRPRGKSTLGLKALLSSNGTRLSDEMKKMHDSNKALLRETLTEEMQKAIRLDLGEM